MARPGLDAARVIEAAARLADAVGLEQVTLAAVASELGVKPPSLYNHVSSLAELRRGVALVALKRLSEALREAAVGRAGREALRAMAHGFRAWGRKHPGLLAASVATPVDAQRVAASHEVLGLLLRVMASVGVEGERAVHAARAMRASVHGFVTLEAGGGFGLPVSLEASFTALVEGWLEAFFPSGTSS